MVNRLNDKKILSFALGLIIFKPIFDLDWRWPLFYIGSIPIPFHRVVAFVVPCIITIVLILRLFFKGSAKINFNIFSVWFLISITITLLLQININSIDEYIRTYSFFIIFLSVPFLILSKQEFYKISKLAVSISLLPTFISYLQTFGVLKFTYYDVIPVIGTIGRVSGGYLHPTGYLNYLLVLIPLTIYLYLNRILSKKYFWFWILFTLPMVGRSLHRATIIIILFNIVIYIYFYRKSWLKYFIFILFFIVLSISFQYLWGFINQGGAITNLNFRGRSTTWPVYIGYFQDSDFFQRIFGFGSPILPNGSYEPHSDWLRILFNYGYSGFIFYVAFLLSVFFVFFTKLLRINRETFVNSEAFLGLILFLTIILYSITMEPLRYSSFSWIYALVLGYLYKEIVNPMKVKIGRNDFNFPKSVNSL